MGRRRKTNLHLPMRMQMKGKSYYYVCAGKWRPLGSNLARARRLWAELEGGGDETVAGLVQRYIDREDRAASTASQYASYMRAISEAFPVSAAALTSQHVALWRETQRHRKTYANGVIGLIVASYKYGEELGLVRSLSVSRWRVAARDILPTEGEIEAIVRVAPDYAGVGIALARLVGARISDILRLRWDDVRDGMLYVRTVKTGQRQAFIVNDELQAILDRAKSRRIVGLYIVADDRGLPVKYKRFQENFLKARRRAGVRDEIHFHDVRALAATDADAAGQDAQALLGHTSRAMTERYVRGRRTIVVEPVRRKK